MKKNLALFAVLVVCALALVTSQHVARKTFVGLEQANSRTKQLEVEWDQLQVEQTKLAKPSLIDSVAKRDLKMQTVEPSRTLYVALPESERPLASNTATESVAVALKANR
jgi:cell division protein FtsL